MLTPKFFAILAAAGLFGAAPAMLIGSSLAASAQTQPARVLPDKAISVAEACGFSVEKGALKIVSSSPPETELVLTPVQGIAGKTFIEHKPDVGNFRLYNEDPGPGGLVRTYIRQIGCLHIQVQTRGPDGTSVLVTLLQAHGGKIGLRQNGLDFNLDGTRVEMVVTRDAKKDKIERYGGEDFPSLAAKHPLEYVEHLAPLFERFGAAELYPLPRALLHQALAEPKPDEAKPEGPAISRENIDTLRTHVGFLRACLACDDLAVRTAALPLLRRATGRAIKFDANAPADEREAALRAVGKELTHATTKPTASTRASPAAMEVSPP